MTFNDIKALLRKQERRFSYEVDSDENIVAIYVEESGITADATTLVLTLLLPDYEVHNCKNLSYIRIEKKVEGKVT